jgi:hypothetical protein
MFHISLTTAALIRKPQSDTLHLRCNSKFIVMPLTFRSPRLSQDLAGIYIWVTKQPPPRNPYQMVSYCAIQQYSDIWSHLWRRLNLVHFLSMKMKAPSRAEHWLKWVTTRTPHNSKLTAPQHMELSITQSNKNAPRQWILDSTGSKTEYNKANLRWIGHQVTPIWGIISVHIILQRITNA